MSGMDVLRERIARALWEEREHYTVAEFTVPWDGALFYMRERYRAKADAVIAALGLREMVDGDGHYWQTPWERIEEGE